MILSIMLKCRKKAKRVHMPWWLFAMDGGIMLGLYKLYEHEGITPLVVTAVLVAVCLTVDWLSPAESTS